jgi:hypothetical protein
VLGLIIEWASLHEEALIANWNRARVRQPLARIEPLE